MAVRFLIADDYSAHQKLIGNILSFLGAEMRCASDGREVMRLAQSEDFQVVLMDLQMPELGGVEAADRLMHGWRNHPLRPRIIAFTGDNTPVRRALCRAIGMDGFIAKPYESATLKLALQQVIMFGHCWPAGVPERSLDLKRFIKRATGMNFEAWSAAAPDALRASVVDPAARAVLEEQARELGFLGLERFLQGRAGAFGDPVVDDLRPCLVAAREALCLTRDEAWATA